MTSIPSGARSLAMAALATSWILGSSRISFSLRATRAWGNFLVKAATSSGSLA
jgi:hypothetical protein